MPSRSRWLARPALVALVASLTATRSGAQDFRWPLHDTGGSQPRAIVAGDFDQDGRPDLASANSSSHSVSVLLAATGGGFEAPLELEQGIQPIDLVSADFDLDGFPDLALVDRFQFPESLKILHAATGWSACGVRGPLEGRALDVGDVDADRRPDLVAVDVSQSLVLVSLTDASGCPTDPSSFATGSKPVGIVLADLDGDGALDVVTCNETSADLALHLGDGAGGFSAPTTVAIGAVPVAVAAADLDGDGAMDVAAASAVSQQVSVFLGDGAGGLAAPLVLSTGIGHPNGLVAADVDADGAVDIVVAFDANTGIGGFGLLRNLGSGAFAPVATHFTALKHAGALAVADVDRDGRLDVLLDATSNSIVVLPGDGQGGFPEPPSIALPAGTNVSTLADLDADGAPELISATGDTQFDPGVVSVALGDGQGGWLPAVAQPTGGATVLHVAPLDGNATPDLLTAGLFNSALVSAGDGAGGLSAPIQSFLSDRMARATTADVDGDGDRDLVMSGVGPTITGAIQYGLFVLPGDGAGHFGSPSFSHDYVLFGFGQPLTVHGHIQTGDMNEDGDLDIALAYGEMRLFFGDGTGSFPATSLAFPGFPFGYGADALRLVDLDGDGHLDLVSVDPSGIVARYGAGDGTFPVAATLGPSHGALALEVVDVDRDGQLDVLTTRPTDSTLAVLHADGAGGYDTRVYFAGSSSDFDVGNVDGDEFPDVVTLQFSTSRGLLLNETPHHAWTNIGYGLAGTNGVPLLVGTGTLAAGSPGTLKLSHANPGKLAVLFISKQSFPAPFKGGVLATVPPLISFMLLTSPAGTINLSWTHWPGGFPGSTWYFQYGVVDSGGPAGAALSNALRATQP